MFSSPKSAVRPHKKRKPATHKTTPPNGMSERCRTIRKSENGMMQNATAADKVEAKLSQVRNCGGVYAFECCTKSANKSEPNIQSARTLRKKRRTNTA